MSSLSSAEREKIKNQIIMTIEELTGMKMDDQANFMELGGNSIVAAQIIGKINQDYGVDIQLGQFLEVENLEQFYDIVLNEIALVQQPESPVPGTEKKYDSHKWPLTSDQERIWFLDRLNPGNPAFNVYTAKRIKGEFRLDLFEESFKHLLERHPLLRVKFVFEDDKIFQVIQDVVNTGNLPRERIGEEEISAKLAEAAAEPLNLSEGTLVRIRIFEIKNDDLILFFNVHHIIADAWSLGVLIDDIMKIYAALHSGQPFPPAPEQTFLDFIRYQESLIEKNREKQLLYWKESLKDVPRTISLPYDKNRPSVLSYKSGSVSFKLNGKLIRGLQKLSSESKVTMFNLLYSAFTTVLYLASEQEQFLLGCPIANRKLADYNRIIGFFTNTLVMKNSFSPEISMLELMKENHNYSTGAFNNSDIPFMTIVQSLVNSREFNANPLFQVMFSMIQIVNKVVKDNYTIESLDMFSGYSDYDLFLIMQVGEEEIKGYLSYSEDLFEKNTVEVFVDHFLSVLEQITADPLVKIDGLKVKGDLKRLVEQYKIRNRKEQIVISSTFSDQPLKEVLSYWMEKLNIPSEVHLADYNQVFNQLLDPSGKMALNREGVNILLVRPEDWVRYQDTGTPEKDRVEKMTGTVEDFLKALQGARFKVPLLLSLLPAEDPVLSGEAARALREKISGAVKSIPNLFLLEPGEITSLYPMESVFDSLTDKAGHVPFTSLYYKALGTLLARKIYALKKLPFKVILLDCDNTLWKGVLGEDGVEGIEIDPPRKAFQELISRQQEMGMLLALVSKNDEENVRQVFEQRGDMRFRLDQIVTMKVNWELKSENIKAIARELNLGMDSFIFIDDSLIECAEVSSSIPEILTIPFPQEEPQIMDLINHGWFWDHLQITEEDKARTVMYKEDLARARDSENFLTHQEFLQSLELRVEIKVMEEGERPRVSQLTLRTNQFNTTTIRRQESDVRQFLAGGGSCLTVKVGDRFGDYGLTGTVFYKIEGKALSVDSLILSCRVLGRGVEHRILNRLGEIAGEHGLEEVIIPVNFTSRNVPVLRFLENLEGVRVEEKSDGKIFRLTSQQVKKLEYNPSSGEIEEAGEAVLKTRSRVDKEVVLEIVKDLHKLESIKTSTLSRGGAVVPEDQPANEVEEKIVKLVKEVLNIDHIGVRENFFDLGGHSLQLVQLLSILKKEFDCALEITDLFQYTNIKKLADYITHGDSGGKLTQVKKRGLQQRERILALKKLKK